MMIFYIEYLHFTMVFFFSPYYKIILSCILFSSGLAYLKLVSDTREYLHEYTLRTIYLRFEMVLPEEGK